MEEKKRFATNADYFRIYRKTTSQFCQEIPTKVEGVA